MNVQRPLIIGISAPQGCGKTTLTNHIKDLFKLINKTCVVMSIDDFYLTGNKQDELAKANPSNPLLQYRGNAGTHDLDLAKDCLRQFLPSVTGGKEGETEHSNIVFTIPVYDKSLRSGRGDRSPVSAWQQISKPVDIVLVEGWMLGFKHIPSLECTTSTTEGTYPGIMDVNRNLKAYTELHHIFDAWLVLAVDSVDVVYQWRLEQEQEMRAAGKEGMTDEQVQDFVSRYMPAYATYLPALYGEEGPDRRTGYKEGETNLFGDSSLRPPETRTICPVLEVKVNKERLPVSSRLY